MLKQGTSVGHDRRDVAFWLHFLRGGRNSMELMTHKKLKSGRLMPWGKGTVVIGAKGFVYLSGNTAAADDYDPTSKKGGGAVGDAAAQWRSGAVARNSQEH